MSNEARWWPHNGVVHSNRISELLQPFTKGNALPPGMAEQLKLYLDLLLRWNAHMNLTAVRDPEQIVTRHFGESLFVAKVLAEQGAFDPPQLTLADVGAGAGFPGVPIKLARPNIGLTLIESQNKKATFLREVLRTLTLQGANVFSDRAEQWGKTADIVMLRAVEQFERVTAVAAALVAPGGKLCLLVGSHQAETIGKMTPERWAWQPPIKIPLSTGRVIVIGQRQPGDRSLT